ncbi:MAG: hypothetical protein WCQ47_04765 [bacterium]
MMKKIVLLFKVKQIIIILLLSLCASSYTYAQDDGLNKKTKDSIRANNNDSTYTNKTTKASLSYTIKTDNKAISFDIF